METRPALRKLAEPLGHLYVVLISSTCGLAARNDKDPPAPPEFTKETGLGGGSLEGCQCWKRGCKAQALPRQLPAVLQVELLQR